MRPFINLLEPEAVVQAFLRHPPQGFKTFLSTDGVPGFDTRFDLLTTAESKLRRIVMALPFYRYWRSMLQPLTCFIGTTVTEYAIFPRQTEPESVLAALKKRYSNKYSFLIVKDLPQSSPLLDACSNAYADKLAVACEALGFILLEGQALAYVTIDFASIDHFISRMSSGRRKDIRRKLRARGGLEIEAVLCGSDRFRNPALLEAYYALYLNVFRQSDVHFDLLSLDFFRDLLHDGSSRGIVFEYRYEGDLVGYNICFVAEGMLIDKYVGFQYPKARALNLYFVSWFHNLGYAVEHGLTHYVAGWTDPDIKGHLGAQFTFTRHAVHVRNGLLRAVLKRITRYFERDRVWKDAQPIGIAGRS